VTLADIARHPIVKSATETWWPWLRAMVPNSLAFRLFAASALWLLVVLPITDWQLYSLYRQEVETTFDQRIADASNALLDSAIERAKANNGIITQPIVLDDPLFRSQLSGWYWQIDPLSGTPGTRITSASLLDGELQMPANATQRAGTQQKIADGAGPDNGAIRLLERVYKLSAGARTHSYRVLVTGSLAEIKFAVERFHNRLYYAFAVLGIGMIAAMALGIRFGLKPLGAIQKGLNDISTGKAKRLEGEFPAEITPLQQELNALIQNNEDIVERARTHVGNLAHALKTPLSVISNEASDHGGPLAKKVAEQAKIMRDQVQHHLDRARMVARTGGIGGVTDIKPVADGLARTLNRIYGGNGIEVTAECPPGLSFQGEKQDLEEMLGNLMDNACKWAATEVRLSVAAVPVPPKDKKAPKLMVLTIDDDGPGLTEEQRVAARQRGKRLDETKPGSGLGMAIVTDLVDLYKGRFDLDRSPQGGLRAILTLPAA
jgi:signal transduction histidine kinase